MLKLEVRTKYSQEEAAARVRQFFSDGFGLEVASESDNGITLVGGGGFVHATYHPLSDRTIVDLETQEWEQQVTKFAEEVS